MNFKKQVNGSWVDTPHYIMGTFTDTITPPTTIYGDGTNATLTINGNTVQNGTPSPSAPVDVVGCGERTGNLTKLTQVTHDGYVKILTPANSHLFDNIEYDTEYTLSWEITSASTSSVYNQIRFLRSNSTSVKEINNGGSFTLTSTEMSEIVSIAFYFGRTNTDGRMYNFMLNRGSTALPYEPYGYKIPILNGSVTTNVYLGEVQTMRNLKKVIITGEEAFVRMNDDYTTTGISINGKNWHPTLSTTGGFLNANNGSKLWISNSAFPNYTTAEAMQEYFAQQYASGNPVEVWYVLASPETGIVNEPLMRLTTSSNVYADSLTTSIATTDGTNSLSVETTVQPSEVTATYKGWHPVADVHERGNGAWT